MCYIFLNSLLFLIKKPTFDSLMHFHLLVNTIMSILAPYNSIFFSSFHLYTAHYAPKHREVPQFDLRTSINMLQKLT